VVWKVGILAVKLLVLVLAVWRLVLVVEQEYVIGQVEWLKVLIVEVGLEKVMVE